MIINIANGQTILSGSIRSSSGLADDHACRRSLTAGWGEMMASQRVGAGEGNRTLDIQLGKLDSLQSYQNDNCKTAPFQSKSHQRVTISLQNHRFRVLRQGVKPLTPLFTLSQMLISRMRTRSV